MAQLVPILALLFSTAFLLAGNGLHSLLLPLRGAAEGFSTNELGLLGTGWATGFVLGCLTAPIVVRRVGHIRAFSCSAACAAMIILLNGIFVEPLAWILLRVGSGFFLAGAFMIIESWLNERATNESRGTIFAVYLMVTYFAITTGQLGVGAGDPTTSTLFMAGAILFCLAVLPTALSTAASPRPLARVKIQVGKLFRNSPVAFLTVLLVGVVNGAFGTLAAVWGARIGLSTPLIALMMGITIVSGALTQLPAGRISDLTDRRYVIAGAAVAAGLAGLAIFILDPRSPTLVLTLDRHLRRAHLSDLRARRGACQRLCRSRRLRGGLRRAAPPLRRGHDDRPARGRRRDDRNRPGGAVSRHLHVARSDRELRDLPHLPARADPRQRARSVPHGALLARHHAADGSARSARGRPFREAAGAL